MRRLTTILTAGLVGTMLAMPATALAQDEERPRRPRAVASEQADRPSERPREVRRDRSDRDRSVEGERRRGASRDEGMRGRPRIEHGRPGRPGMKSDRSGRGSQSMRGRLGDRRDRGMRFQMRPPMKAEMKAETTAECVEAPTWSVPRAHATAATSRATTARSRPDRFAA